MDPVGRFLRVFLSPEKKSDSIRPGAVIKAEVIRPLSDNLWLLQVGSRRFSAASTYNLLELSQSTGLEMKVEQGSDGLIFRLLHPPEEPDSIQLLLQDLGFTEHNEAYRGLIRIFMQLGLPLSENYTLPALQQLRRLLRDFPSVRQRYPEISRLIAMFTDRGVQVPDEILFSLLGPRLQKQETWQEPERQEDSRLQQDQKQSEHIQQDVFLFVPAEQESVDPSSAGYQLLNSIQGSTEESWLIVPFSFGNSELDLNSVHGDIRINLGSGSPGLTILSAESADPEWGRWIFFWNQNDPSQQLEVLWDQAASSGREKSGLLEKLRTAVADSGFTLPDEIRVLENWDGFHIDAGYEENNTGMIKVDAYG
ncbi:hypothetical protein [Spirochaeta dissipatitropha]